MDLAETKTIKIVLNGESRDVPTGLNIGQLLAWLKMDPSRVAVELNRIMVRKPDWPSSQIEDGAQVEVVWFVGGGCTPAPSAGERGPDAASNWHEHKLRDGQS